MYECESNALAAKAFVHTFGEPLTTVDIAPRLTCQEAGALAILLDANGAGEAAEFWLKKHAESHDEGDEPHGLADAWIAAMEICRS